MKKPQKYLVNVVPLARLPLSGRQTFSYEFERELCAGTLVSIPLSGRFLSGIVVDSSHNFNGLGKTHPAECRKAAFRRSGIFHGVKLKKIANVLEESFLAPDQLELAKFISDYYVCSLGVVLKFFVPGRVKARNLKSLPRRQAGEIRNNAQKKIMLTREQQNAVDIITKKNNWKFLLFGPASSGKTEVYIHAISKISAGGGSQPKADQSMAGGKNQKSKCQFLVLLPELTLTPQAIERYGVIFKPEEMVVIHSKISKGELYSGWQKIKSGQAKIIIGTRMAVFAPFKNLKLIIIDEEQDVSFKQWDMNPRYDARTVAEKMAEIHGAKIVRGSATPGIESYFRAKAGEYELLTLPKLQIANYTSPDPNIVIADMKKEYFKNPKNDLSPLLVAEIKNVLERKRQALVFINRKGMSSFSLCAGCGILVSCPNCDRALIQNSDGYHHCPHCSFRTEIFWKCKKCQSMQMKNVGTGTQKIERQLKAIFSSHRIEVSDAASDRTRDSIEKTYADFMEGEIDILIGTQMITKGWDNPNIEVVGIIDADNLFSLPDVFTDQYGFNHIMQAAGRVSRPESQRAGTVVLQTYKPENPLYKHILNRDYESFFSMEIEKRKSLGYPPFLRIIKLVCREKTAEGVEKEAKRMYDEIISLKAGRSILVSPPYQPLVSKSRNLYRRQILIRYSGKLELKLKKILSGLESSWIIDTDPISIS